MALFEKNIAIFQQNKNQIVDIITMAGLVISVVMVPLILLQLYGIKTINSKLISIVFFLFDFILIAIHGLYKNKHILLLMTFFVWMGVTSLLDGAELSKAWGGAVVRSWLICIFIFLIAYIIGKGKEKKWFNSIIFSVEISSCIFFILILYNAFKGLFDTAFVTNLAKGIMQNGRLHGFGNANTLGTVAIISFIAGVLSICYIRPDFRKNKSEGFIRILICVSGLFTVVLSVIILTLCRSRASIIALGIGFALIIFRQAYDKWFIKSKARVLLSIIAAVLAALVLIAISVSGKKVCDTMVNNYAENAVSEEQQEEIIQKITPYGYDYALDTLTDRTLIWPATINMLNEEPTRWIIGVTAAKSPTVFINYIYENRPELYAVFAHNGMLQYIFMYGIPGAVILLLILILWLVKGVKVYFGQFYKESAACYMVPFAVMAIIIGLAEVYPFPFWTFQLLTYMFFATAGSCCSKADDKMEKKAEQNQRLMKIWFIVLVVVFVVANIVCVAASGIMKYQEKHAETHTDIVQDEETIYSLLEKSVDDEMLSANYWVKNCEERNQKADRILMSSEEIDEFNQKNRKRLSSMNLNIALEDIGKKFNGKVLKSFINDSIGGLSDDVDNSSISREEYNQALEYAGLDSIGPNVDTVFAYAVNRSSLRKLPGISEAVYDKSDSLKQDDIMAVSEVMPCAPVVVLYSTSDGKWIYVLTEDCGGWVPRDVIAFCKNKEEWNTLAKRTMDYLVVTGVNISVNSKKGYSVSLPMGTVVNAKKATSDEGILGYYLELPVSEGGMLEIEYVFVPENEDISYAGYLPFTQANILRQAFKFLGNEYGWAGTRDSVDCSLFIKEIYASFGISLPRNSLAQAYVEEAEIKSFFINSNARKDYLEDCPAGTLLYFKGHIAVFLGCVDGLPYCISSVGEIETMNMKIGSKIPLNKVTVTNMQYTTRANGVNWLNSLERIITIAGKQ